MSEARFADSQSYKTCAKCGTQFPAAEHVEPKRTTSKRFQCDICNRFYATPITLKAHRIRHSKAKNELCDFCGASFKTRGQLKIHRRAHTGEKPYQCDQCDKAFAYRESLITHSTLHSRIKPFVCSCCDARFSCITNLLKHRKVRGNKCGLVDGAPIQRVVPRPNKKTMPNLTDRSKKRLTQKNLCMILQSCNRWINVAMRMSIKRDEETLQKQLTVLRESSEALASCYQCKLCPQRYTSEYLMARHLDRIHNLQQDKVCEKLQYAKKIVKGTAKYRCKYCDQSYVTAARLKQHVPKHGPNGRLRFKCCCCVMYFETSELAHEHALAEHRERLVCDVCQKQFNKPETLQRHSRYVHNSEQKARKRQYICSRCGRKLPTTAALFDHERADCGSSPLYPCNTCGKRYASFSSLKIHQTVHENRLPFECGYCEKKFRTKGQLKVHDRAHTGEKPFRCEVCSKAFPYRESLLTHRTTHTGIMRYECLDCNQKFSCITNLQSHRRTRHNEGERKRSKISKRNHNKFE
ncbi:zinc finger protein 845-like [Anopheles nili]|uniref:zinc finger protein 845-like n=1 Tax=Anopheles nili TaxID=185578 RepID=UPI00237AFB23|nr:zinc finger protein 845-like [Anopheles nili]